MEHRHGMLTYIAVDVELDIGVVRPYDMIDATSEIFEEEPKT